MLQNQSTQDEISNNARTEDARKLGNDMKALEGRMSSLENNFLTLHTSVTAVLAQQPQQPQQRSAMEAFHKSAVELFGEEMGGRIAQLASELAT